MLAQPLSVNVKNRRAIPPRLRGLFANIKYCLDIGVFLIIFSKESK
jgi:hypothetical protein